MARGTVVKRLTKGSSLTYTEGDANLTRLDLRTPYYDVVADYSADDTGLTNATTAIQTAINDAASAGAGTVFIPAGTYLLTTGLTLPSGVRLLGEGQKSVLVANDNNITLISDTTSGNEFFYNISNLWIYAAAKTGCTAIKIFGQDVSNRALNITIQDVYISGAFAVGVSLKWAANIYLSNIKCVSCIIGILCNICADVDYIGCSSQSGVTGAGFSIIGDSGASTADEGHRMTCCSTNGQAIGLSIINQDYFHASSCSFTTDDDGCVVLVGAGHFSMNGGEVGATSGVAAIQTDSNCQFCRFDSIEVLLGTIGLDLDGTDHIVTSCVFHSNAVGQPDIILSATSARCIVSNNLCLTNTTGNVSIAEVAGGNYNSYTGNICKDAISETGANNVNANNIESY